MMSYELIRGDARHVSDLLAPASVDLFVTSPPYFALRSYRDDGEHYDGQLGSEATPGEFVDNLIECTRDWLKVLKPGGSIFVNLGDKRAGSGGHNNQALSNWHTAPLAGGRGRLPELGESQSTAAAKQRATRRNAPDRYNQHSDGIPTKSLMGLPWRYALRCIDELGLILRADIIWHKPNGLPESVTDRVRQSHEYWFHLTREARYFASVDEVREEHSPISLRLADGARRAVENGSGYTTKYATGAYERPQGSMSKGLRDLNPLGKLPGSVWTIPSEPLTVPDHLGVDHFAAFPSEWPRRLILGWSPTGWCEGCGEPRRAVVEKELVGKGHTQKDHQTAARLEMPAEMRGGGLRSPDYVFSLQQARILGYACACPDTAAPTRPAVVLDPFAGTGTTVAVAHHLGRHGIGIDLSRDYLRLAEWRCEHDTALRDKVLSRSDLPKAPVIDGQMGLFG